MCDAHGLDCTEALDDAVSRACGIAGSASLDQVLDSFGHLLLVLDGLDALVEEASSRLQSWLDAAPSMTCLATSRRRLGRSDESVVELSPLQLPVGDGLEGEAAELFLRCVGKVRAGYQPSAAEAPFVSELVRQLDGVPLALQLAAPRLAVMGPAVLLHRLRTSRSMLRVQPTSPSSHDSFDTALEGSWQALSQTERDVLGQLTAFSDGMTAEAVEAVAVLPDTTRVIDVLQVLRDRSMLQSVVQEDGSVRLHILHGVRDFVRRRSDPAVLRDAERRHAAYFAERADRLGLTPQGAAGEAARRWLWHERSNLLSVVRRVARAEHVTARTAEPALRVLLALDPINGAKAPAHELVTLLDAALDATRDSGADPLLFGRAMALRGAMRRRQGRIAAAMRDLMQALHVAETLGVTPLLGTALLEIGHVLMERGELDEAGRHFERAMAAFQTSRVRRSEAAAWEAQAELERRGGALEAVLPLLERAIAWHGRLGDHSREAEVRCTLARTLLDLGNHKDAIDQVARVQALSLESDADVLLEAQLVDAIAQHDMTTPVDISLYAELESRARLRGALLVEAEALFCQALASAQTHGFGQAHALMMAALDLGLQRDHTLWSAIAAAIDAASMPTHASSQPMQIEETNRTHQEAIRALLDIAHQPARFREARQKLARAAPRSVIVRLALRALDQAFDSKAGPAIPIDALAIGESGQWFRMPGDEMVSLERRRPLARLLARLGQARVQHTGEALSWDELQQAGWPGERILATAGAHRVRVAISTLRKLGLRDALETTPEGYRLSITLPVACLDAADLDR